MVLNLDEVQSYFDGKHELHLTFDKFYINIDGIDIYMNNIPLLKNNSNNKIFFPDRTKYIIQHFMTQAKEQKEDRVMLEPNGKNLLKRYDYCSDLNFIYSSIDYEYIPGLVRPWDEGFLTPVFFNLAVLNKYSQHPEYKLDLFADTYGSIRCGDEWNIQFGINKNKKVIMWLGDISSLPKNEQYFLRSENIESDHDIHSEFYNGQIDVQWSESSKQNKLFELRSNFKILVNEKYDFDLYILDGEVSKIFENLDRPVFWEDKHISPVVESLNRIFVESINSKGIKEKLQGLVIKKEIEGKGSMKLLEIWLEKVLSLDVTDIKEIMCPFYVLNDFRIITCHLCSEESRVSKLESIKERLNLEVGASNEAIFDKLIEDTSISYSKLINVI